MPQTKRDAAEGDLLEGFTRYMPQKRPKSAPPFQSVSILRKGGLVMSADIAQLLGERAEVYYNARTRQLGLRHAEPNDPMSLPVDHKNGRFALRGSAAILANYGYEQEEARVNIKVEIKGGAVFIPLAGAQNHAHAS